MTTASAKTGLSSRGMWGLIILISAVVVMAAIAALPFYWHSANSAALAEAQAELRFIEARLKSANRNSPAGLTIADNIDQIFIQSTTSGLGQASLQQILGRIADENRMVVERAQPLDSERHGNLAVLRLEIEASGSIEGLRGYLHAIETGQPFIFVNRAKISAPETGEGNPSDRLTVALQVEAYSWWDSEP
jgi:Type II secretion system (T2SS), protein M subtype b